MMSALRLAEAIQASSSFDPLSQKKPKIVDRRNYTRTQSLCCLTSKACVVVETVSSSDLADRRGTENYCPADFLRTFG